MKNILLGLFIIWGCALQAQLQKIGYTVTPEDIIAATKVNVNDFDKVVTTFNDDHKQLGEELLAVFTNTNSSNLSQCEAAYFLGELKISQAVDSLSARIALRLDVSHLIITHFPAITRTPAMDALIKIGNPSIPALVQNLRENDDSKVRELSLTALYRIEGDKDIVQLRLQKALKVEKDSQKQARLQAALKSFSEIK